MLADGFPGYDRSTPAQRGGPYPQVGYAPPAGMGGPPPGWGAHPAHTPPPAKPGTNGFARAALALGIGGGLLLIAVFLPGINGGAILALALGIVVGLLLSVVFGFVALSQIKKTRESGRGLAIAGLILSGLWALVIALFVVAAVTIPS
jgi:hypothetical protein